MGKIPHAAEQLSQGVTTTEARTPLSPCSATKEATTMRNLHTTTKSSPLLATTREKHAAQRRPSTAKNKQTEDVRHPSDMGSSANVGPAFQISCHLGKVDPDSGGTQRPPPPGSSPSVLSPWVSHLPASLTLTICLVSMSVCVFHSCCRESKRP